MHIKPQTLVAIGDSSAHHSLHLPSGLSLVLLSLLHFEVGIGVLDILDFRTLAVSLTQLVADVKLGPCICAVLAQLTSNREPTHALHVALVHLPEIMTLTLASIAAHLQLSHSQWLRILGLYSLALTVG
jgi:hypothetical protein